MNALTLEQISQTGDNHASSSELTPIRPDAFDISDAEKKEKIAYHFREIMLALGLDLEDDSLHGTPARVAKMYVDEIFSGLNPINIPKIALFENKFRYNDMLVEKNIGLYSMCEHHFLPIVGKAHVAYYSSGKIVGLSKLNRIVKHFARRPQVQERMTREIAAYLCEVLETPNVAVLIDARHYCVSMRGVEDVASYTVTSDYRGSFQESDIQNKFLDYIRL